MPVNDYSPTPLRKSRDLGLPEDGDESKTLDVIRPLPEDMWGVTILSICTDFAEMFDGTISVARALRMTFSVVAMAVNLWMQFVILSEVNHFIVGKALHDVQSNYMQYHREAFHSNGSFIEHRWKAWDAKSSKKLCNMAIDKNALFGICVIFVWAGRMLGELRTIDKLLRDIWKVAKLPPGMPVSDMVEEVRNPETRKIELFQLRHLNCITRTLIYILVIIPKLIIAVVLMFIGCRWLAAAVKRTDLILNALSLEFVIGIDEHILDKFAPQRLKERVRAFEIIHRVSPLNESPTSKRKVMSSYGRSLLYLCLGCLWSWVYMMHLQQVVPGFNYDVRMHCAEQDRLFEPLCLPFDDPDKCFPFGR